ncbi:MAG: hypothetical protein P8M25_04885 [Paracoccaceae bacterium]|nr:hypothetical protein [Paracoccaceae bacterium]
MITGEHAVVYGYPAVVCAIDQRVRITVTAIKPRLVQIISEIADPVELPLDNFRVEGPMRFVLGALALYRDRLEHGVRLIITSQIDPMFGLGSSAAVTVATLGILREVTSKEGTALILQSKAELHTAALKLIRQLQGLGSGADLAASLHGGLLGYRLPPEAIDPSLPKWGAHTEGLNRLPSQTKHLSLDIRHAQIIALPQPPQISLCYCGYKMPTGEVLARVAAKMQGHETEFAALYARMGDSALAALYAAQQSDWVQFSDHLNVYQALMVELNVSDAVLDALVSRARAEAEVTAAKISGSGLGDCILAVGRVPPQHQLAPFSKEGFVLHD